MTCSICIGPINDEINTKCKHSFCNKCLTNWLLTNNTCPECRYNIIDINEDSNYESDIDIECNEGLKSGLRRHEFSNVEKYRDFVEDEIFDLIDNIDDEEYLDELDVDIENGIYNFELVFEEKFKTIIAEVDYNSFHKICDIIYDIKYKVKKNKKFSYNKIKNNHKINNKNFKFIRQ